MDNYTHLSKRKERPHTPLWIFLTLSAALAGFLKLAQEVSDGSTHYIDKKIILALRSENSSWNSEWILEMMRDITGLGGFAIMTLCIATCMGYLLIKRKFKASIYLILSVTSGTALSLILKYVFVRPRPELVEHLSHSVTPSFPSGHTMNSAIVYITIGVIVSKFHHHPIIKSYILCVPLLITILVGISRVYLGVHWPSDILAGWLAGIIWALLCGHLGGVLQESGKIETN